MQAVFGLIEHDRHLRLDHVGRHFLAAMGGQAMHEQRARLGQRHQLVVDLVGHEDAPPDFGLGLLAHRRPRVGVDRIGAGHGIGGVGEEAQPRAVPRHRRRLLHDRVRQLIRLGAGHVHVNAEHRRRVDQRRRHVVAVADVGDRPPAQRSDVLLQRQEVGDRLAGVLLIGERVDHVQPRRRRREFLEHLLGEGADDHRIDPALEIARDVGHRLAPAERDVRLQRDQVPAELADRDLEGRARAQRRLVEEHRDVAAAQRLGRRRMASERAVGLHLRRELQAALEVGRVEVQDRQEVLALRHQGVMSTWLRSGNPR